MDNKYQRGKIYKLTSNQTDKIYIGSTIQTLNRRLMGHKCDFNRGRSGCNRELIQYSDVNIELIEDYPCNTKRELEIREQYFIDKLDCVNTKRAYMTKEDRLKMNRICDKKRTRDHKPYLKQYREYRASWGGDTRSNNNLLETDVNIFQE